MVIRDGKIANYHPYPPTPWNANPRDSYGTPGPYEDAVQGQPIFEENDRENFKGIDIMRTVRSFDPCLPCGVHMYLGDGKTLERLHSPTQSPDRGVMHGGSPEESPRATRSGARRAIESRHCWTPARRAAPPRASAPSSWSARSSSSTAPAWSGSSDGGRRSGRWTERLAADDLVASLLLVHGLHPHDVHRRVSDALDRVRPYLGSHGGDVAAARGRRRTRGTVRLQFAGSCKSCPSSAVTLELAVEDAIRAAAPEVSSIEVVAAEHDVRHRR